jgi:coenzyme F420 hydrogenase subunit beta
MNSVSGIAAKGPADLQKDVLNKGLCLACGACANLCPYINMVQERPVIIESCGLSEGKCYDFCPRTYIDLPMLDKNVFGACRSDLALGSNLAVVKAKSKDSEIKSAAQYGGVASALMAFALQTGEVDAAILTKSKDKLCPKPTLAKNKKGVLECAGTKYVVCPTITKATVALRKGTQRIGVVATPCQVIALRKMQASKFETGARKISLVIGLFCTWALSPRVYSFIKGVTGSVNVVKLDVPPPPANTFIIETEKDKIEVPLDKIRKFILPSCNVCFDMTSEFADISVGTVEGEEGWNTVIVRTSSGKKFFEKAKKAGIIEVAPIDKQRSDHLREASLNKKRRALEEMESLKTSYLILREEDISRLIL